MKGLIDSTLREGSQTFGLAFTLNQKKEIFSGLCQAGIEEIEIGLATKLDEDLPQLVEFCRSTGAANRLALWSRCRLEDILYAHTLQPDVLSLSIPVSDIHIEKKLGRDRKWVLKTVASSIQRARQLGFNEISLGLEDATRADRTFLENIAQTAIAGGVDRVRLADTVGIASPGEFGGLVRSMKALGPVAVGVHAHNDFGMATANSLAALDAGAEWADVTILGLGERAGNACLEELAAYLVLKRDSRYKLQQIVELAKRVAAMSGRTIEPHSPVVGEGIFYCETGLHLQGLQRDAATYEPFSPELVGARRKLQYGAKIGRKEILACMRNMKISTADFNLDEAARSARRMTAATGRLVEGEELASLITTAINC